MKKRALRLAALSVFRQFGTRLALLFLFVASSFSAERQVLPGHVPVVVAKFSMKPLGRLPAAENLELVIGLSPA